ncbi:MAG TPA: ABC transporter permease, partial [Anaerolineae bacterium]|nr:ABC transporter permease [Anaerolineae bacterium]
MFVYLLKRLINAGLILLGLSFLVYLLMFLAPADPAQVIASQRLGQPAKSDDIAQVRAAFGLDQPIVMQYLRWLGQTLQGDFGYSIRTDKLIRAELSSRVGWSLLLGSVAMGLVLLVGTTAGIWAALRPKSVLDQAVRLVGLVGVSIPDFWLAFVLILIFAVYLGWLPSFGAKSGWHLILPVVTLAVGQAARLSQITRSILGDVLRQDYLRTAQAKGLSQATRLFRHALPNIAVPYVTVVAYQFSALISGTIIIETVFSWPGLGSYYIEAV